MKKMACPVCGEKGIEEEFDICPCCSWQYDETQQENDDEIGANELSLSDARKAFKNGRLELIQGYRDDGYEEGKSPRKIGDSVRKMRFDEAMFLEDFSGKDRWDLIHADDEEMKTLYKKLNDTRLDGDEDRFRTGVISRMKEFM